MPYPDARVRTEDQKHGERPSVLDWAGDGLADQVDAGLGSLASRRGGFLQIPATARVAALSADVTASGSPQNVVVDDATVFQAGDTASLDFGPSREQVTITAVPDSTHITAIFTLDHAIGTLVVVDTVSATFPQGTTLWDLRANVMKLQRGNAAAPVTKTDRLHPMLWLYEKNDTVVPGYDPGELNPWGYCPLLRVEVESTSGLVTSPHGAIFAKMDGVRGRAYAFTTAPITASSSPQTVAVDSVDTIREDTPMAVAWGTLVSESLDVTIVDSTHVSATFLGDHPAGTLIGLPFQGDKIVVGVQVSDSPGNQSNLCALNLNVTAKSSNTVIAQGMEIDVTNQTGTYPGFFGNGPWTIGAAIMAAGGATSSHGVFIGAAEPASNFFYGIGIAAAANTGLVVQDGGAGAPQVGIAVLGATSYGLVIGSDQVNYLQANYPPPRDPGDAAIVLTKVASLPTQSNLIRFHATDIGTAASTLASTLYSTATSFTVVSGAGYSNGDYVIIESEIIGPITVSGSTLTGDRGAWHTIPGNHLAGIPVNRNPALHSYDWMANAYTGLIFNKDVNWTGAAINPDGAFDSQTGFRLRDSSNFEIGGLVNTSGAAQGFIGSAGPYAGSALFVGGGVLSLGATSPLGGFRYDSGHVEWSDDLSTWHAFGGSSGGPLVLPLNGIIDIHSLSAGGAGGVFQGTGDPDPGTIAGYGPWMFENAYFEVSPNYTDAWALSGFYTVTFPTGAFTSADINKSITIAGAGAGGGTYTSRVTGVAGGTTISVADPIGTTVMPASSAKIGGFVQIQGGIPSLAFTANLHKEFSFYFGAAGGVDGRAVALDRVFKIDSNGVPTWKNGALIVDGSPDPNGAITGTPGSLYLRQNGSVYRKASGSGNTGWTELGVVDPGIVLYAVGGSLTLTTVYQTIGFQTVTLTRPGTWIITVICSIVPQNIDGSVTAQLAINGVGGYGNAINVQATGSDVETNAWYGIMEYVYTGAAGTEVLTVQAKKLSGSGASYVGGGSIKAHWVNY